MKQELWLRLRHYHFDHLVPAHLQDHVLALFNGADASTQAFASKLARKRGWSRAFALRAIEEYRKFVFLGLVSDTPVTPPKIIDEVWHEHLLFSRGYREFCRDVLQRDFDHHPELVPYEAQTETFQSQYVATLDRYEQEFNVTAPADIWGTPKFRAEDVRQKSRIRDRRSVGLDSSGDVPLYMMFDGGSSSDGLSAASMAEFGGGGGFSGAGGESSWSGSHDSGHHSGHGSDSGSSSDSGSDSGSSSDGGGGDSGGGGSCSSGCGGGGCGGGGCSS